MEPLDQEAIEFMLKEYDLLRDLRNDLLKTQESRITVYTTLIGLSVAAAISAATGVLKDPTASDSLVSKLSKEFTAVFPFVGALAGFCILLLGLITFVRMIERSIETVIAMRGMNRIRRYFVHTHPLLEKHLIMSRFGPNEPAFWQTGLLKGRVWIATGLPQFVAILNSFFVAAIVRVWVVIRPQTAAATAVIPPQTVTPQQSFPWILGVFVSMMVLQNLWFWLRLCAMQRDFEEPADRDEAGA